MSRKNQHKTISLFENPTEETYRFFGCMAPSYGAFLKNYYEDLLECAKSLPPNNRSYMVLKCAFLAQTINELCRKLHDIKPSEDSQEIWDTIAGLRRVYVHFGRHDKNSKQLTTFKGKNLSIEDLHSFHEAENTFRKFYKPMLSEGKNSEEIAKDFCFKCVEATMKLIKRGKYPFRVCSHEDFR